MNKGSYHGSRRVNVMVCLLLCVFIIMLIPETVFAANTNQIGITDDSGTENRTVINRPGSAENAGDLRELNVANNLTDFCPDRSISR